MKAGHFDVVRSILVESVPPAKLAGVIAGVIVACKFQDGDRVFIEADGPHVLIKRTRTINGDDLPQTAFSRLSHDCEDVLIAETGLDPEQLLKEAQRAA
jgi:hypothetical protein